MLKEDVGVIGAGLAELAEVEIGADRTAETLAFYGVIATALAPKRVNRIFIDRLDFLLSPFLFLVNSILLEIDFLPVICRYKVRVLRYGIRGVGKDFEIGLRH